MAISAQTAVVIRASQSRGRSAHFTVFVQFGLRIVDSGLFSLKPCDGAHEAEEVTDEPFAARTFENVPARLAEALIRDVGHLTVSVKVREPARVTVLARVRRDEDGVLTLLVRHIDRGQLVSTTGSGATANGEVHAHHLLPDLARHLLGHDRIMLSLGQCAGNLFLSNRAQLRDRAFDSGAGSSSG